MTLASAIVTRAFRELNLVAAGQSPTSAEQAEGLELLNDLLGSLPGYGIGREISDLNVGGQWDQSGCLGDHLPEDTRLVLNLSGASAFSLHPHPYEGQRIAVADAGNNLAANPLTLDGNGRRIEGGSSVTLSTNGLSRQWIYRADTGSWERLTPLAAGDSLPFPAEFDQFFALLLAMRVGARNGVALPESSQVWLENLTNQVEARYRRPRDPVDWPSPALLGRDSRYESYYGSDRAFSRGRAW